MISDKRVSAPGSLVVAGTGIRPTMQLTPEAEAAIRHSERVFYLVGDWSFRIRIRALNPKAEDLFPLYSEELPRSKTYENMTRTIVEPVTKGLSVCAVVYGHPTVLANPTHEAIRQVQALGGTTRMLPAVSAHDALLADFGIDPGATGFQIFEATSYIVRKPYDVTIPLALYQISAVGDANYYRHQWPMICVPILVDVLSRRYGPDHECFLYRAATSVLWESEIVPTKINQLGDAKLESEHTLYIPPKTEAPQDEDILHRIRRLRCEYYRKTGKPIPDSDREFLSNEAVEKS